MKELFEFCEKNGIRMRIEYDIHIFNDRLIFTFQKASYACLRYVSKEELHDIPNNTLIEGIIDFVENEFASVIEKPNFKICPSCQGQGLYIYMGQARECSTCNGTGKVLGEGEVD